MVSPFPPPSPSPPCPPPAPPSFPQHGGCLCGALRYRLLEDPVTLYACHCTDCQRATGAGFGLSMIVRLRALDKARGEPRAHAVTLDGERRKVSYACPDCGTRLFSESASPGLLVLRPGTLDDTSWLVLVGHIWTRSAQPWVRFPDDVLQIERQPDPEQWAALARAWKSRGESRHDLR